MAIQRNYLKNKPAKLVAGYYSKLAGSQIAKCMNKSVNSFSDGVKMIYTKDEAPVFVSVNWFINGEGEFIKYAYDLKNSVLFTENHFSRFSYFKHHS
ncbi:MAG: hypothetical protein JJV97_03480 [SAR324 cluster bacterium]|nr:hypothetical protein [SAR324 cluster bacterium]